MVSKALFRLKKILPQNITSNVWTHAWSIKCGQNKKLIAHYTCKLRDESFESNYAMI